MSFFFGGNDNAAPVLVKHIANDFLCGWFWAVGDDDDDDDDDDVVDSPFGDDWCGVAT